ncbi:EpsI family protein [Deefgea piscis]|uniref:EpsI family protein n=1 Tax=Deefgea piscis TaxID=2739061 RepID=A0A6M8SQ41_9NEIS|nr:exosortase-associated protein EpsI, B-type [Deefgea piscis]QKJ66851.1 EpsI family protein [Deefgea piscis]
MNNKLITHTILCFLMLFSALFTWYLTSKDSKINFSAPEKLAMTIPAKIGEWTEEVQNTNVVVNPELEASVNRLYSDVLSRTYVNNKGDRIMLVIAYGEDQREGNALHYPEVCYPAQGFVIDSSKDDSILIANKDLRVRRVMTNHSQERFEPVTYWTTLSGEVVRGNVEKKTKEIMKKWHGDVLDGYLIRVSTIDKNPQSAFSIQDSFIRELIKSLDKGMAARLAGDL